MNDCILARYIHTVVLFIQTVNPLTMQRLALIPIALASANRGKYDTCSQLSLHEDTAVSLKRGTAREKVLVTGGAGFLGSHVTELLLDLGYYVRVLDDLKDGSSLEYLPIQHPHLEIQVGQAEDLETMHTAMRDIDGVMHL